MKTVKYIVLSIAILWMHSAFLEAQESSNSDIYYTYEYEAKTLSKDSLAQLFCVIEIKQIEIFEKIRIDYNQKKLEILVSDIMSNQDSRYKYQEGKLIFEIPEKLNNPFIEVFVYNANGDVQNAMFQNKLGEKLDPKEEKAKWVRYKTRNDSMDFIRKFNNVYIGNDGRPRYQNSSGEVYIINKKSIQKEN